MVTNQAPQMKYWRNIITESLSFASGRSRVSAHGSSRILMLRYDTRSPWSCSAMCPFGARP